VFDVSFAELAVIGAVALVVLGPERLPAVARTIGALIGRAQRFVASVKADLNREVQQTELAKIEAELRAEGDGLRNTIHQSLVEPVQQAREELSTLAAPLQQPLSSALDDMAADAAGTPDLSVPEISTADMPAVYAAQVEPVETAAPSDLSETPPVEVEVAPSASAAVRVAEAVAPLEDASAVEAVHHLDAAARTVFDERQLDLFDAPPAVVAAGNDRR
jgi:sec-independent protein translocase protein TatB